MVHYVQSAEDLKEKLAEAGDKLVVIDFFAVWCGPCKLIDPQLKEFSEEKPEVVFLKVDVDGVDDVAEEYGISSMPTFIFIKNGKTLDSFSGASINKLKDMVEKYQ